MPETAEKEKDIPADRAILISDLKRLAREVRREAIRAKRELETRIERLDELTNQITSLVE